MTIRIAAIGAAAALVAAPALANEHPHEHPSAGEHPAAGAAEETERPASTPAKVTAEGLARAIRAWVERDVRVRGGRFVVFDAVEDRPLALELVRVHDDRLSRLGPRSYFACADFRAKDGTIYDIDIFMEGGNLDHLEATEVHVHKVGGRERYTWREKEDGTWERLAVTHEAAEQPETRPEEHPAGAEHPR